MSQLSKIEWTDATWNPVRGCSRVSEGCRLSTEHVVTADERSTAPIAVKEGESSAAAARAIDHRILFPGKSPTKTNRSLERSMVSNRRNDLEILWSIVCLVAVQVVNLLTFSKRPADLLLGHKAVLINVAPGVGQSVAANLDEDVARGRSDGPSALPVRVSFSRMNDSHALRIARSNH